MEKKTKGTDDRLSIELQFTEIALHAVDGEGAGRRFLRTGLTSSTTAALRVASVSLLSVSVPIL